MDSLEEAAKAVLPALRSIRGGFGPKPVVAIDAIAALADVAGRAGLSGGDGEAGGTGGASAEPVANQVESPKTSPAVRVTTPRVDGTSPVGAAEREWTWETLRDAALRCTECSHLAATRTQVVFGVGDPNADLMFVGEAPGADEDEMGEPFVGAAGELLTKIIQTMGFSRDTVYICNVLKCRPDMPPGSSGNRKPTVDEMRTCLPWLKAQIRLVKPKVIVALGATAVEGLLGDTRLMRELRGRWLDTDGIPVMVTYHPAYLLRNQALTEKRKVWEDLLQVMDRLGCPISEKQRGFFKPKE